MCIKKDNIKSELTGEDFFKGQLVWYHKEGTKEDVWIEKIYDDDSIDINFLEIQDLKGNVIEEVEPSVLKVPHKNKAKEGEHYWIEDEVRLTDVEKEKIYKEVDEEIRLQEEN